MSEERIEGLGPGIVTKVAGKGEDAVHPTEYLVAVVLPTHPVGDFRTPAGAPDMARVEPAKAREHSFSTSNISMDCHRHRPRLSPQPNGLHCCGEGITQNYTSR
jgi:hypothetical protein